MKSRFLLSLSKYFHTKYWLASPPAGSHLTALKTMSKYQELVPAACRQFRGCPVPVPCASQDTPGCCSARCFPCSPADCRGSLSDPRLSPKVTAMAQGLWEHHITSDRGNSFQHSLHQHLGCWHTASHGACPCESFGFTARTPKL